MRSVGLPEVGEVTEQADMMKEFAHRRVNLFFSLVVAIAFTGVLADEVADLSDIIDDGGIVVLAVIAIAFMAMKWRSSPAGLKSVNNVVAGIVVVMILLTFFGIYNEMGDAKAFGDDIAQLIVTVVFLLNRFIP